MKNKKVIPVRLTGSRVGAALGLDPYTSPDDLIREMVRKTHSAESEFKGNVATDYGTANEFVATMDYETETGNSIQEPKYYTYEDWLGAKADGELEDRIVEIKCPYSLRNSGELKDISEYQNYLAQMQIEMFCSGKHKCDFYQWTPRYARLTTVSLSVTWLAENLPKLKEFYARYLSEIDNKEHLEPLRVELTALNIHNLADEYDDLKEAIDEAKARQQDILKELSEASKGKNAFIGDYKLTKITRKGSVSYAKVVKQYCPDVDLEEFTGSSTSYWSLK